MPRHRRRQQGQQWRRHLRNIPAHQAAAAPAPPAIPPAPPPPPPLPAPQGEARVRPVVPRRRPIRPAGQGQKNNDNLFVRNRGRCKIKRIMAAQKKVEVKHRGRTVRRMVARRHAIYPALRQQCEY